MTMWHRFSDPGFGRAPETPTAGHRHGNCLLQALLCQVSLCLCVKNSVVKIVVVVIVIAGNGGVVINIVVVVVIFY